MATPGLTCREGIGCMIDPKKYMVRDNKRKTIKLQLIIKDHPKLRDAQEQKKEFRNRIMLFKRVWISRMEYQYREQKII